LESGARATRGRARRDRGVVFRGRFGREAQQRPGPLHKGGTLAGIIALGTHFPAPACDFNGGTNDCWAEYLGFGLQPGSLTVAFTRFDSEPYFMADSALVASDGTVSNGPMFGCGFGLTTFYVTGFLADGTPITSNIATSPC
jgi:hypothetical protein